MKDLDLIVERVAVLNLQKEDILVLKINRVISLAAREAILTSAAQAFCAMGLGDQKLLVLDADMSLEVIRRENADA